MAVLARRWDPLRDLLTIQGERRYGTFLRRITLPPPNATHRRSRRR